MVFNSGLVTPWVASLRSLEKCILAPKSLGATSLPVRLFEAKELMLFLPVSSHLAQATSAMALPSLARM
jgi:hypothetical protein